VNSLDVFKKNVRVRLDQLGWDFAKLAEKTGMPKSHFSKFFSPSAKSSPSLKVLDRIAMALQTTPSALLDAHEPPPKSHQPKDCLKVAIRTLRGLSESTLDAFLDDYLKP
jgi:transcriptional regulator with XRE-family HTH domain